MELWNYGIMELWIKDVLMEENATQTSGGLSFRYGHGRRGVQYF